MTYHHIRRVFLLAICLFAFSSEPFSQKPKPRQTPQTITVYGGDDIAVAPPDAIPSLKPDVQRRLDSFHKVWQTLRDNYFDQTFNNLDWNKIKGEYRPKVLAAKTDSDFHRLMQEMINLLNRSHFVIVPPEVYREIERARVEAKEKEKQRREGMIADGADPEDIPEVGPLFDDSKYRFGTGIELRLIKGKFIISRIEKDSAADYVGVKAGFILDEINGVSLSDMVGRTLIYYSYIRNIERYLPQQIVSAFLNGEKDSVVTIKCLDAEDKAVEFKIRRERLLGQRISIGENYPEQFLQFETRSLSEDVGYIRFNMFALPIVEKFCGAISEFKEKKALVIDLRGNGGGIIGTIYGLSGMLTDGSLDMGSSIYKIGSEKLTATSKAKNFKGRVVFLVDNQTISAAEIFAAGIQENSRALVVGETTAGEALPSMTVELATGAVFMYPIANFKTAKGNYLEGAGVKPDFVVALDRKALLSGADVQLDKALSLIAENKAFPVATSPMEPTRIFGPSSAPPPMAPPTPKPVPKIVQGDQNLVISGGFGGGSGTPVKTIQGNDIKPPVAIRSAPPSIFTKEIVAAKDARSSQVISEFIATIGETGWKSISSYSASGKNGAEIKGAKAEWDFHAYRKEPDNYTIIISSPVIGEVREVYTAKKAFVQSDLGVEKTLQPGGDGFRYDLFAPIRTLLDSDAIQSLSYQGTFDREGRKCHVIEARTKAGDTIGLAFDVETKLLVSYATRFYTVAYGDYRKVADLLMPFHVDMGRGGNISLTGIVVNQPIDPATFIRKENCFDKPNP